MGTRKVAMLVAAVLWTGHFIRFAAVWDQLPERVASHFNSDGVADGWMSRTGFVAFDVLIGGGVTLLLLSGGYWLRALPTEMINLPHKAYWLAPERRGAGLEIVSDGMAWMGVLMTGLLVAVGELALRANLSGAVALDQRWFTRLMAGFFICCGIGVAAMYWRLRPPRA